MLNMHTPLDDLTTTELSILCQAVGLEPAGQRSPSGAWFDDSGQYRYSLWRQWDPGAEMCAFIALNPSTADATNNDPTVTREINLAKSWGYGGLIKLNLFAHRATDPNDMKRAADPVGPFNDGVLRLVPRVMALTVCCWGVNGIHRNRSAVVTGMLRNLVQDHPEINLCYLRLTKNGHPQHPLYLPRNLTPTPWNLT